MGIGFLLFGYFFFCDLTIGVPGTTLRFDVLPDVFGWVLLFIGSLRAGRYSTQLQTGKYLCLSMILPSAFSLLHDLDLWHYAFADTFYGMAYPFLSVFLMVVYHYYLLFGLKQIADECGDQQALSARLSRNFYMTLICFFWILAARIVLVFAPQLQGYCALVSAFATMVYLLLNGFAIYRFFRNITLG